MMETTQPENYFYQRFCVLHRLMHIGVMLAFTGLTVSGFTLKYSAYGWARFLAFCMGGAVGTGNLHRFCAALLYLCVIGHVLWLVYYKLVLKGSLTGPQSVFPRRKDFQDLSQNLRYIFRRGRPPRYNRYSYLAKVDYWAVMLGMQSMGITGLIMWYPEFFATLMPGYAINIANELHFHEAVLAVLYIGGVHMSDTHLFPEVFPLEKSIFNGKISRERLMQEHPGEWEGLEAVKPAGAPEKE